MAPLLNNLDADHSLAVNTKLGWKIIFLLTNLPYWYLAIVLVSNVFDEEENVKTCQHNRDLSSESLFALLGITVALSSTLMHASQLQLGNKHLCCGNEDLSECFHKRSSQVVFKLVDVFCACSAAFVLINCQAWEDLYFAFLVCIPSFILGVFLKRIESHLAYMFFHGIWHISTAYIVMKNV